MRDAPGRIYFVQECRTGNACEDFIKIGWSQNISLRISLIGLVTPFPLKVLTSFPGTRRQEQKLHRIFSEARFRGEWFKPCQGILDILETGSLPDLADHLYENRQERKLLRLTLYKPDDAEAIIKQAKYLAIDQDTSFNAIVWQALREYLAKHKGKEKNARDTLLDKKK